MKKILLAVVGVVALLVIAVVVAPLLIPNAAYKQELLNRVEAATGRTARIDGSFAFTILPRLGLVADKVTLANAPGAAPAEMMTIDKLSLEVALWPLLSGNVVVRSLVLGKPVIHLAIDRNGRPNWRFAAAPAPAPAAGAGGASGAAAAPALRGLSLSQVRIVGGTLTYADARSGTRHEADAVDLALSLSSLDKPMRITGALTWRGDRIALAAQVADPAALFAGKPAALSGEIKAKPWNAGFNGTVTAATPVAARGALSVTAASFGPLTLRADADAAGSRVALQHAAFSFGAVKGSGELTFNGAGARPVVDAKLTLSKVDLDPYLPSPGAAPAPAPAPSAAHPAPARGAAPPPANAAPAGLGGLRRVDGTADLTLAGLVAHKLTLGPAHIVLRLKDGRLASNLDRAAFYGGGATAALTVDATTATPRMTLSATLAGVQLGPLLAAAADSNRLQGTADLDLKVAGAGASRRAIMASLSGSGRISVRNGALRGIDLAKLMSGVSSTLKNPSAAHLPKATGSSEKTEFSQLSGSYTIHNGILVNNDLSLRGASFTAGGTGRVNLVDRTLNYRLVAKLDLPSTVRIGGVTMSEVTVPVVVSGPWNAPDYRPDLAAMVRDLAKGRALHELQKRLGGGKGLGQVLRGLTGGSGGSSGGNVLQGLFGH